MKILALEFSANERSVAVLEQTAAAVRVLASETEGDFRGVTGLTIVDRAMSCAETKPDEIEQIAIGLGPGSYTGIRSAIALAQGWQLGRDVKLMGISSVACLAEQARESGMRGRLIIVIDAQRQEVYRARYELDSTDLKEVEPLKIVSPAEILPNDVVIGPEASRFVPGAKDVFPSAEVLGKLALRGGAIVAGEELEPIYLRQTAFVKAPAPRDISSGRPEKKRE